MSIETGTVDYAEAVNLTVGMGEAIVAESPHVLSCIGLGSCLAVALYDKVTAFGGLAHIMLPKINESHDVSSYARYRDTAIAMMLNEMQEQGVSICHLEAKIFGGANMFSEIISSESTMNIGQRNVAAVMDELNLRDIEIVAKDVGGNAGRSLQFDLQDGSVLVRTINIGENKY